MKFIFRSVIILMNKNLTVIIWQIVKKKSYSLLNGTFFYVIIICQGFTNLDVMFDMLGGGLNDELGFDCLAVIITAFLFFSSQK